MRELFFQFQFDGHAANFTFQSTHGMDYFLNRHDVVKAFHLLPKKNKKQKNTLQNLRVCFAFYPNSVNFQCNNIMGNANKCPYSID